MAKIGDFGEKIGGARKDLYGLNRELRLEDITDWSDIDRDKYITKKEVFPQPNYQKLYEGGMNREVLFFVKQIRDALPTETSHCSYIIILCLMNRLSLFFIRHVISYFWRRSCWQGIPDHTSWRALTATTWMWTPLCPLTASPSVTWRSRATW